MSKERRRRGNTGSRRRKLLKIGVRARWANGTTGRRIEIDQPATVIRVGSQLAIVTGENRQSLYELVRSEAAEGGNSEK